MATDRIYGDFQYAGVKVTTAAKSKVNNDGTDAYAPLVGFLGADGLTLATTSNAIPTAASPSSGSSGGIAPSANTAVASSKVLKASPGNLYRVNVVAGASAGYVMIFNATSAPADGAVTPVKVLPIAANGGLDWDFSTMPLVMSTGITVVFSTTGPYTKTASATAFIAGEAV